ncbi:MULTISPECIES: YlmC/YmxH family sporulation protein [Caloramator]|jgi:YlmC/YmxH family sporulation protein|uniref:PRC-barrel domain protein n=1 Tax=Caloramator australicus RC3 TaxID=857293 RepID=I7LJ21_9CLOT|nr:MULTISPECIES: YlmC/YmxH family sporulation protein [Caloramator]MDO6354398.1 YlmC/YmxH family sporulation protein [Caloramator sp. CAR-1]CCJ33372.1 PRC-barrel domain protein [Caloramator australicus RC3]
MRDNLENVHVTLSELRQMEVIDINKGKRLGFISDLIFDDNLERIEYIVIPPENAFLSFFKKRDEILISWNKVKTIGVDVILIDLLQDNSEE